MPRSPVVIVPQKQNFALSPTLQLEEEKASDIIDVKPRKECKKSCKDGKICNYTSGRCVKAPKDKNVVVKRVPKAKVIVSGPCKKDCAAVNKICKEETGRCVNPPKKKAPINANNFKPCKKSCKEGKKCNFGTGRCIKK